MSKQLDLSHILVMKAGPYCGYSLDEIIEIKKSEEKNCGKFYWGYGGVFCHPDKVNAFVYHAVSNKQKPIILFSPTNSSFQATKFGKFSLFSTSKQTWTKIPNKVLLVGNQNVPHFAIVAKNLRKIEFHLNLSDYCGFNGIFPNPDKYLNTYFQYRVDKACGYYLPRNLEDKKLIKIGYSAELIEPYCVYIK